MSEKPYTKLLDAFVEVRNEQYTVPDVVYVGSDFMEELQDSDDFIMVNSEKSAGVKIAGVEIREHPQVLGIWIPIPEIGHEGYYYR